MSTKACFEFLDAPIREAFALESSGAWKHVHEGLSLDDVPCVHILEGLQLDLGSFPISFFVNTGHCFVLSISVSWFYFDVQKLRVNVIDVHVFVSFDF